MTRRTPDARQRIVQVRVPVLEVWLRASSSSVKNARSTSTLFSLGQVRFLPVSTRGGVTHYAKMLMPDGGYLCMHTKRLMASSHQGFLGCVEMTSSARLQFDSVRIMWLSSFKPKEQGEERGHGGPTGRRNAVQPPHLAPTPLLRLFAETKAFCLEDVTAPPALTLFPFAPKIFHVLCLAPGASLLLVEVGCPDGDACLDRLRHLEQVRGTGSRVGEGHGLRNAGGCAVDVTVPKFCPSDGGPTEHEGRQFKVHRVVSVEGRGWGRGF